MRVLFVTAECYPLIKTGGLADVAGALPQALGRLGWEVRVLLPAYPGVVERLGAIEHVAAVPDLFGGPGRLVHGRMDHDLAVLALEAAHLYERPGNPYLGPDGKDWPDNHLRFAALCWAASRIGLRARRLAAGPGARPRLAGRARARLPRVRGEPRPPTVITVHNLAFQGLFPAALLGDLRLPASSFTVAGLEYHGLISFLKAGLQYADRITTVSPTYTREIRIKGIRDRWIR